MTTHYLQAITVAYSKQRLASETIATTPTTTRNNYLGPKGVDKASMLIKLHAKKVDFTLPYLVLVSELR